MYRLVASDMDETFVANDHSVVEGNVKAVHELEKLGVSFVVASGRPAWSLQDIVSSLGLSGRNDCYTISLNGAYVVRNDGKVLRSKPLDREIAEKIFAFGKTKELCIHVYTKDELYIDNISDEELDYLKNHVEYKPLPDGVLPPPGTDIYKIIFQSLDLNYLRDLRVQLTQELGEQLDNTETFFTSSRYMEFNANGVNKGEGLEIVAEKAGMALDDIVAVGDSLNDLPMLKIAGLSCAVANASPLIIDDVDVVLESTNDDAAMAEVVERFIRPQHEA